MAERRGFSVVKRLRHELGLTLMGLSCLTGREERTFGLYFAGGVIPKGFASWLLRLKSIAIQPGEVVITLRMPEHFVHRGYPPAAVLDLTKTDAKTQEKVRKEIIP